MPRRARLLAIGAVLAALAAGCGRSAERSLSGPDVGLRGADEEVPQRLGFPAFATKNTTRVGGADPIANAAAVARAVYPGGTSGGRPPAVALVDPGDWRSALAASVLMSAPLRAPVLFAERDRLPRATADALTGLAPLGARRARNAQIVRVGDVAAPEGLRATDVQGRGPFALAAAIDRLASSARGTPSDRVVVVSADAPQFAMPAAAWAAKAGDPILFVRRQEVPRETRAALAAHQQPRIYVVGPRTTVGGGAIRQLRELGTVTRIEGPDPVRNAIAFARFVDRSFGWGVIDPGHGLVFATAERPLDAAAAAPLSASGTYGPLLVLDNADRLPAPVTRFLLNIRPGYRRDPVRGLYNHGWLIGDERAISVAVQSRIDALLEIVPIGRRAAS